jgi:hypothetical protein
VNWRSFVPAATAVMLSATACSGAFEPAQDPPTLGSVSVITWMYDRVDPAEGYVEIAGSAADPQFEAHARSGFPVEVRSSSGDAEQALFRRSICGPDAGGALWDCHGIIIGMAAGHSVHDVYPNVRAMGARFRAVSPIGASAGVRLFGTSVNDALRIARRWPGVTSADLNEIGFPADGGTFAIGRFLSASIRLDYRSPVRGNGILEAAHGDTLRMTYTQPDGSLLIREWLAP